ncbi:hypothetical protein OUZ56_013024 [Daphnia magna]|uniref:Uncharacterized protein n=1 Tax=Daphnia magna TaxID=35525 RepID=A0ABQ9Z4Q1_9CRUS|nr:hypothetical protein OUZ56_013024 [Daphnia magna]
MEMEEDGKRKVFDQTLPKNIKSMKKNQRLHSLVRWDFVRKPPSTKKRGKKTQTNKQIHLETRFVWQEKCDFGRKKRRRLCVHTTVDLCQKKKVIEFLLFFSFLFRFGINKWKEKTIKTFLINNNCIFFVLCIKTFELYLFRVAFRDEVEQRRLLQSLKMKKN